MFVSCVAGKVPYDAILHSFVVCGTNRPQNLLSVLFPVVLFPVRSAEMCSSSRKIRKGDIDKNAADHC